MARKFQNRCVYCLREFPKKEITIDHVIARSWYPSDTPPVEKWKAPSCRECNGKKSEIEETLRVRIALCLNPDNEGEKAIIDSVFRAINPNEAKSPKDFEHRLNKRRALLGQIETFPDRNAPGILPSFQENYDKGSRVGVLLPAEKLEKLIEGWTRGIHWCETGEYIESNKNIKNLPLSDETAREVFGDVMKFSQTVEKGPAMKIIFWHATEGDKSQSAYAFTLYRNFKFYVFVTFD